MLDPSYLAGCAEDVAKLFAKLEADITADIAARVAKMGRYSDTSQWQAMKLREASAAFDMCNRMLKKCRQKTSRGIKTIFVLGSKEALAFDDAIYRAAGMHPASIASSKALMDVIVAGVQKTNGLMDNLTMTTARDASHSIQNALDQAYMQVMSGAYSYDEAARHCINQLGEKGYRAYVYDSGTHTSLEAASRRALLTGLNQTTAQLQLARAQDMQCDLVEVTSHAGARPEHAEWQGRIYCLNGKRGKYKDFYKETGYGTGPGLCGWNCYHNFYPYLEGVSTPSFEHDPAKRLGISNNELYEITQTQRLLERRVRESRRQCQTINAAIQQSSEDLAEKLERDFSAASVKLKRREAKLMEFCEQTGLRYDSTRVTTYGFSRSASAKAVWANRKSTSFTLQTQYGKITIDERVPDKFSLSNVAARKWYKEHDARIPELIDKSLPLEDQARQACELRNAFRTMTRDFMEDQETRKQLDRDSPNKTFEELIKHKMNDKHMTREEAIQDILKTSTKTNSKVNKELGLEE
ncbi:phage minor capsid protein [Butyricicoccus sp.]|uniref:phage minor capsid protein n=1 Tax=Butyricicoccus sp. TaxID=2049021 RepID=UPI003AB0F45A